MRRNWTREETIVAFNVYCKIPFKNSSKSHPTIIKYSKLIGRSPSALNMKIGNFGRLDPELKKHGITGLVNGSKLEETVWNEFHGNWSDLAFESEKIIAALKGIKIDDEFNLGSFPEGSDRNRLVKTRVNQSFFRSSVISAYNLTCCITGIKIPDLLIASHIIPWKESIERTNPHNGLCLNSLHEKAFDRGFLTITPDLKIMVSKYFNDYSNDKSINNYFIKYDKQNIIKPEKFFPAKEFLDYHFQNIFIK